MVYCSRCREGEGWICEQHPNRHFPHDGCNGPGMPCVNGCNPLDPVSKKPSCYVWLAQQEGACGRTAWYTYLAEERERPLVDVSNKG